MCGTGSASVEPQALASGPVCLPRGLENPTLAITPHKSRTPASTCRLTGR